MFFSFSSTFSRTCFFGHVPPIEWTVYIESVVRVVPYRLIDMDVYNTIAPLGNLPSCAFSRERGGLSGRPGSIRLERVSLKLEVGRVSDHLGRFSGEGRENFGGSKRKISQGESKETKEEMQTLISKGEPGGRSRMRHLGSQILFDFD